MVKSATRHTPTITAFAANCAIAALRKRGIEALPLLRHAGLDNLDLGDPQVRIPAARQGEFLEHAAEAMADTAFGLHLAEQANPRDSGLLFYVGAAAGDLREAVTLYLRYSRLINESLRLKFERSVVEFNFVGVSQQRVRQNTEFWIGIIVKSIREITGRDIGPRRIACPHLRNTDLTEFARCYGCPVEFGAPVGRLAFANEIFDIPLVTQDRRLLETLRPFCEAAARARHVGEGSFRTSVENEVQRLLMQGQLNVDAVAKALAVSARTMSRRLSEEGTNFGEVVDQLRYTLALQYLKRPDMKAAQIGWILGYESQSSFNHAFRRWTGQSPSAARSEIQLPSMS